MLAVSCEQIHSRHVIPGNQPLDLIENRHRIERAELWFEPLHFKPDRMPVSFTGFPAISLPCGFSSSGLPIGLQIVANDFQEQLMLRIANAFEQATDFHLKRPPNYWNGRS